VAKERRYSGALWLLLWAGVVMLATLVADCLYVMWPYPDHARGIETFQTSVKDQWASLVQLSGDRLAPLAEAIYRWLHTVLFRWPGFDYMISRAHDPTPMDGGGEMMRKAVLTSRDLWGAALTGLQLFSARLGVIVLSLPLLMLAALAAGIDGMAGWYKRRTGGGRESGFVYHRAKRHAGHALLAIALIYLVPPVLIDPRLVITASAFAFATFVRIAAASFKKYV
jgi:integrating conjugative element membrane protein (TIGR03747 family)